MAIDDDLDEQGLAARFDQCLTGSVEDLLGELPRVVLGDRGWTLPAADLGALRDWGIPSMRQADPEEAVQLVADLQDADEPAVALGERRGYRLGAYWRLTLAAVAGTGEVVGLRADAQAPFGINTTTRAFAELAWRWGVGSVYLRALVTRGMSSGDVLFDRLEAFQELCRRVDPGSANDPAYGFWDDIVNGW